MSSPPFSPLGIPKEGHLGACAQHTPPPHPHLPQARFWAVQPWDSVCSSEQGHH